MSFSANVNKSEIQENGVVVPSGSSKSSEIEKVPKPILRCSALGTPSISTNVRRRTPGSAAAEEGTYSVPNAALAYSAANTRAASPTSTGKFSKLLVIYT